MVLPEPAAPPESPAAPPESGADQPAARAERAKRELRLAVLLSVLGSAGVLFAASRAWVTFSSEQVLTIARSTTEVSGNLIVPGARALALVGLAGVVAVAATRRTGRALVGLLVLAAGLGVMSVVGTVLADSLLTRGIQAAANERGLQLLQGVTHPVWAYGCLLGGLVLTLAGLLVAVRGRRWAALSSAYEPPVPRPAAMNEAPPAGDKAVWDALDRGDDPTT